MHFKNIIYFVCTLFVLSCTPGGTSDAPSTEQPKMLWFDSEANFRRFSSKDSISYYLDRAKATGFNTIVVDVRPVQGDVLYDSDILDPLTGFGDGYTYERDWDYLQYFIDEARRRDLKVTVSASIMPVGLVATQSGPAYRSTLWDDKIAIGHTPEGLKNMKETDYIGVFLNPHLASVRQLVKNYVTEIVSRYDFDTFCLDYCRFADHRFDFSDSTRLAFESYIGQEVENFPDDIFSYNAKNERVPGPHYKSWWEFRAMTIKDIVGELSEAVRTHKPDMKVTYWAASWIHAIHGNGQNWASEGLFDAAEAYPQWASEGYASTGFADHLDSFMVGAYLSDVYGLDNNESIEFALNRADSLIGGDCKVYGSIYALSNQNNMEDAVALTLEKSEGLMVFDIVQVIEYDLWDDIKKGIARAETDQFKGTF